jgi:small subunit ribosomal protein S18
MIRKTIRVKTNCPFDKDAVVIGYRDLSILGKYVSPRGRILPRQKTGVCATHQRQLGNAIKKARFMALMPYNDQHALS